MYFSFIYHLLFEPLNRNILNWFMFAKHLKIGIHGFSKIRTNKLNVIGKEKLDSWSDVIFAKSTHNKTQLDVWFAVTKQKNTKQSKKNELESYLNILYN